MIRQVYTLLWCLILPIVFIRLLWRSVGNKAYLSNIGQRLGIVKPLSNNEHQDDVYWVHAVSVGEVNVALPLIEKIQQECHERKQKIQFVVTTMTPTGKAQLLKLLNQKELTVSVEHRYIPYDIPLFIQGFINKIKPKKLIVIETEIWPNLYHVVHHHDIPIVIANMRLSEKSYQGYKKIEKILSPTLNKVHKFLTQSIFDLERIIGLGVNEDKVVNVGNIKFDQKPPSSIKEEGEKIREKFNPKTKVWIAASTHKGEDEQLLYVHEKLLAQNENILLILVPRHPERFQQVGDLINKCGLSFDKYSNFNDIDSISTQVLLGDTMGDLLKLYQASDIAFVGGSLVDVGGHNVLEPLIQNIPVIYGPYMHNFLAIHQDLQRAKGAKQVMDKSALYDEMLAWTKDDSVAKQCLNNSRQILEQGEGSLARHVSHIVN